MVQPEHVARQQIYIVGQADGVIEAEKSGSAGMRRRQPNAHKYSNVPPKELPAWPRLFDRSENIAINNDAPHSYVPKRRERFSPPERSARHEHHALPEAWESMDYANFLTERRRLMADIICRGFETLK